MPWGEHLRSSVPYPRKRVHACARLHAPDRSRARGGSCGHRAGFEIVLSQKKPLCPGSVRGESATRARSTQPGCEGCALPGYSGTSRFRKQAGLTSVGRSSLHTFVELSGIRDNALLPKIRSRCRARPAPCTSHEQSHWQTPHASLESPEGNNCQSILAATEE